MDPDKTDPIGVVLSGFTLFVCMLKSVLDLSIVCLFVALRPKSTAMAMAGRSVHLTRVLSGQA